MRDTTRPNTGPKKTSPHATGDFRIGAGPTMIVASFVNPVLVTLPFFGFKARHRFDDCPAQIEERTAERVCCSANLLKVYTYGLCIAAALASCVVFRSACSVEQLREPLSEPQTAIWDQLLQIR